MHTECLISTCGPSEKGRWGCGAHVSSVCRSGFRALLFVVSQHVIDVGTMIPPESTLVTSTGSAAFSPTYVRCARRKASIKRPFSRRSERRTRGSILGELMH